jgi:hypothetical protein
MRIDSLIVSALGLPFPGEPLMNRSIAITYRMRRAAGNVVPTRKRLTIIGAAAFLATVPTPAQNSDLQQRFASVKQSVAENQRKLQQYQWVETTQLTLNGDAKPAKQSLCQYGPDGTVQKTPMGPPPEPPSGRRVKQRIIEKKTEEMQ